jgi:hypothetical protein
MRTETGFPPAEMACWVLRPSSDMQRRLCRFSPIVSPASNHPMMAIMALASELKAAVCNIISLSVGEPDRDTPPSN